MSERLSAIYQLTLWRTREFLREPEAVFWVFAFPILLAFALGLAFKNRGPENVKIGVLNTAGAPEVRVALDSAGAPVERPATHAEHCRLMLDVSALAAGQTDVRARFHYFNAFNALWWQVDDVVLGQTSCSPLPGGLVVGNVLDRNTGAGLDGAAVANLAGGPTATVAIRGETVEIMAQPACTGCRRRP